MDSIEVSDAQSAAVAKTPNRVSLADIEAAIAEEYTFSAGQAIGKPALPAPHPALYVFTLCILVMKNGFMVLGKSAPADLANFDKALGAKFAREDAIRQLWPLMGFALRDKLAAR